MSSVKRWTAFEFIFAIAVLVFLLVLHEAIPFLTVPTLGQAVWMSGFSQSLANGPIYDLYAHNFGVPKPAAIAFGLSGALPASLLIRCGLQPADAYTGVVAFWLVVAFVSAFKIGRALGGTRLSSLLGGAVWLSMPILWAHAGYSMLSMGMALMSFYFLGAIRLFMLDPLAQKISVFSIVFYCIAAVISIFMDGYTFVMFAVGASALFIISFLMRKDIRSLLLKVALPVHLCSMAFAYLLFSGYIGRSSFEPQSLDFFRGWGLDLSFLVIPTTGILWLPDLLGLSVSRNESVYFGDYSVWTTTFALPIIITGLVSGWVVRRDCRLVVGVLLIALFGFYMALGPSLKINSTKPLSWQQSASLQHMALMPSSLALMPTGSALISEKLPGFNVMRASYRWAVLGVFALWLLVMICVTRKERTHRALCALLMLGIMICNLPDIAQKWQSGKDRRMLFQQIDDALIPEIDQDVKPGELVALLPWGNDFIAGYLAARANFYTFNIGGDKNLAAAQAQWPSGMLALEGEIGVKSIPRIINMLSTSSVDAVVLPYFNMLWSPHLWPCMSETSATLTPNLVAKYSQIPGFTCPSQRKRELSDVVSALRSNSYLAVKETDLFVTVRLRPEFRSPEGKGTIMGQALKNISYPLFLGAGLSNSSLVLADGWYPAEAQRVWSRAHAKLVLPTPGNCPGTQCFAVLKFNVFGAGAARPIKIEVKSVAGDQVWHQSLSLNSNDSHDLWVPLTNGLGSQFVELDVLNATSPHALAGAPDQRTLGIALERIDISSQ